MRSLGDSQARLKCCGVCMSVYVVCACESVFVFVDRPNKSTIYSMQTYGLHSLQLQFTKT